MEDTAPSQGLDRRRRELGLSDERLSQRCGLSRPTVYTRRMMDFRIMMRAGDSRVTIADLGEAKHASPFRPFLIRMADGETCTIRHPENSAWDEASRTAVCRSEDAWAVIDVGRITSPGDASKT